MIGRYPLNYTNKLPNTKKVNDVDDDKDYNIYFDNCKKHYDTILETFGPTNKYNVIASLITDNYTMTHQNYCNYGEIFFVNKALLLYAMKHDDLNILNMLLKYDMFVKKQELLHIIFRHNNKKFFEIIFDNVLWINISIRELVFHIIINKYDVYFLDMLNKTNYKIDDLDIARIIISNNIDAIKYCMANDYNIQWTCDMYCASFISISDEMLKLLINYGINMTFSLNSIFKGRIVKNDIDMIIFLIHTYPEYNINDLLIICIDYNNVQILKHLLQCGADINAINNHSLDKLNINFETIKFIIQLGIELPQETLNQHMVKCFIMDVMMDNVLYLVGHGADINYMFKFEESRKMNIIISNDKAKIQDGDYKYVMSALEHMICMGKMDHLKYLINNCYDLMMIESDRLLIIAICNGQYDMAKCFLEMDSKVDDMGLVCACFFGHLDMLKLLLSKDIDIHMVNDNFKYGLYNVLAVGFGVKIYSNKNVIYDELIKNNNIFRNDIFQFGNDYVDIFKILIGLNVCIRDCKKFLDYGAFYEVDIINYYVSNGGNSDFVLAKCIIFGKLDIVKMLLGMIDKVTINDFYIDEIIDGSKELKILFDEHGYVSQFK